MILTDDEIRKAAEFAAAQMWPESGYVGWTEDDAVFHRKFIEACLEKLRGGAELPEPIAFCDDKIVKGGVGSFARKDTKAYWAKGDFVDRARAETLKHPLCTIESALQYGAAQRLAGQQRETCTWTEQDDKDMPGTYASSCGEMWSFTDGGIKENRVTYCHHCGGKVVPASPQEQA